MEIIKAGKGKEVNSSLNAPEKCTDLGYFNFGPVRFMSGF
jgi:hypothetical protein